MTQQEILVKPNDYSDAGNATVFVREYHEDVIYTDSMSSTDPFVVEEKYKQPETVRPSHTLCLFTNHLPRVSATDTGTWRRIIVIPFNAVIEKGSTVQNYADHLVKEAGGAILAWAIEGAQNFARNGFHLDIPESVEESTEAYRERENWLEGFIEERCVREANASTAARELYKAYKDWTVDTGEYTHSEKDFAAEMEKLGYRKIKRKSGLVYIGLYLSDDSRQDELPL